jgi:hypothetical protein
MKGFVATGRYGDTVCPPLYMNGTDTQCPCTVRSRTRCNNVNMKYEILTQVIDNQYFMILYNHNYLEKLSIVFSIIAQHANNCASVMTKGGAKRMILPCVGLASKPFSASCIQISQAV